MDDVAGMRRHELEAHAKALRTIQAITDALFSAIEPRDVLSRALDAIADFTHFPGVAVFSLNERERRLELVGARGFSVETLRAARHLPLDASLTGIAIARRQLVTSDDIGADARTAQVVREHLAAEGFIGTASVPVVLGDRVVGALNLIYRGEIGLDTPERRLVSSVAKLIGVALERAYHVERIESEIEERRRAEAQLEAARRRAEESERRFATTLRSIADAVVATDATSRVTFMNHEAERLTGVAFADARARPLAEVFRLEREHGAEPADSPLAGVLDGLPPPPPDPRAWLVARDGERRIVDHAASPIRDELGELQGAVLVFRDVTLSRREADWLAFVSDASAVLTSSLDFEATLAQVAHLAVHALADWCVVDLVQPDGRIARLAGAHAEASAQPEVDALVAASRIDPDARSGVAWAIRNGRSIVRTALGPEGLEPGPSLEVATTDAKHLELLRRLGGRSFLCVPLPARDRIVGALTFVATHDAHRYGPRDVARAEELARRCAIAIDNARLYREAREAVAVRDEFLSVASHELRTPIAALQLDLQSLQRGARDASIAPRLARAMRQVERLTNLIGTLLDVSRVAAGRLRLEVEELELGALVEEVVERFRPEAAIAGCALTVRREADVVGRWDPTRIDQVLSNLLSNALKYGAGAPIEVVVDRVGADARVRVTDHGIGLAASDVARIFERFERAVSSKHYGGLGLGLHIAREIVRAHGGSISVESAPGAGASFAVLLPPTTPAA